MSTWPTVPVQGQLELHKDNESQQTNKNKQKEGPWSKDGILKQCFGNLFQQTSLYAFFMVK